MRLPPFVALRRGVLLATVTLLTARPASGQPSRATTALDTAIIRMGGADILRHVSRVRFEMITQWQRNVFDGRRYADQPTYEWHSDLRDYDNSSWRNTRRFLAGAAWREIADIIQDSVAIRRSLGGSGGVASPAIAAPGQWTTLNIAYVDERRELFSMAPERILLAARAAADLRMLSDTLIDGAAHSRVVATTNGFRATLFLRKSDGFLAMARFRAAEPNDFGLVPWGTMDCEFWYSAWRKEPDGIVYPHQWDVRRIGQPYKRMTVVSAAFNPPASPDSFVVTDSLRLAYFRSATRPMHDVPFDSARLIDGRFASFGAPGAPAGAVKLGKRWVLLEGGQAPLSAERAAGWLASADSGSRIAAALLTVPGSGNGGVAWLASRGVPIYAAPGAAPAALTALHGYGAPAKTLTSVSRGRWIAIGGDSLWVEAMNLPDAPGALIAYVPSLEWVYAGVAANPLHLDLVLAHARAAGWHVSRVGSARNPMTLLSPDLRLSADRSRAP